MQIDTFFTAGVAAEMNVSVTFNRFVFGSIHRHRSGDWGEISEDDRANNNAAPLNALSAYAASDGHKIWIKQDCNVLTVLFPNEY